MGGGKVSNSTLSRRKNAGGRGSIKQEVGNQVLHQITKSGMKAGDLALSKSCT